MPVNDTQIDAAVPAAGTPNRALTNAALKDFVDDIAAKADTSHSHAISDVTNLQTELDGKSDNGHGHVIANIGGLPAALDAIDGEFERDISLTGGTTQLAKATHRNALLILASGSNTITAPASDQGVWVVSVLNDTSADQTVAGQTVSAGSLTSLIVQGTTVTPRSSSHTKKFSPFIFDGRNGVLYEGAPFSDPYTVLSVKTVCSSGDIDLAVAIEDAVDDGGYTGVTDLGAVDVNTTRATATAGGANVSDNGGRRLRFTGSNNNSATNIQIEVTVRV